MSNAVPEADLSEPHPLEAHPVLDYGGTDDLALAKLVRGVAWLLLVLGGIGTLTNGVGGVLTWSEISSSSGLRDYSYAYFASVSFSAVSSGLYSVGGLLLLLRRSAGRNFVVVGAAISVVGTVSMPFIWQALTESFAEFFSSNNGAYFGLRLLQSFVAALFPLLLLWLFTRPLIRDAIGAK